MSEATLAALPAPPEWDAVAHLIDEQAEQLAGWIALARAAQRDWTELVRQLDAQCIQSVAARACAEALEELLRKLADELVRAYQIAVG